MGFKGINIMDIKITIMAVTRLIYGLISLFGGLLIFYFKDLHSAMKINSFMGSLGPFVFLGLSLIGITGLAKEVEIWKLSIIILGVILIMIGTR
jgi:hypothetical protein